MSGIKPLNQLLLNVRIVNDQPIPLSANDCPHQTINQNTNDSKRHIFPSISQGQKEHHRCQQNETFASYHRQKRRKHCCGRPSVTSKQIAYQSQHHGVTGLGKGRMDIGQNDGLPSKKEYSKPRIFQPHPPCGEIDQPRRAQNTQMIKKQNARDPKPRKRHRKKRKKGLAPLVQQEFRMMRCPTSIQIMIPRILSARRF